MNRFDEIWSIWINLTKKYFNKKKIIVKYLSLHLGWKLHWN